MAIGKQQKEHGVMLVLPLARWPTNLSPVYQFPGKPKNLTQDIAFRRPNDLKQRKVRLESFMTSFLLEYMLISTAVWENRADNSIFFNQSSETLNTYNATETVRKRSLAPKHSSIDEGHRPSSAMTHTPTILCQLLQPKEVDVSWIDTLSSHLPHCLMFNLNLHCREESERACHSKVPQRPHMAVKERCPLSPAVGHERKTRLLFAEEV